MKKKWLPIWLFLVVFVLLASGCNDKDGSVDHRDESNIVEMEVEGKVYNNDPGASIYSDVYGEEPVDIVVSDVENGDPYATYLLGVLYFTNNPRHGLERDTEKGKKLLEDAWRMGVVDAGYVLYEMHIQGLGVGRSVDTAIRYLEASAEMGYMKSQMELAKDYSDRGLVDYLPENYQLAREWFLKSAEQGNKEAGMALATMYHDGLGVDKDEALAFEWVSKIESLEYGGATFGFSALAWYYENGVGTNVDLVQAYKYYDLLSPGNNDDKARIAEKMSPEQVNEAIRLSHEWQVENNISMPYSNGYRYR